MNREKISVCIPTYNGEKYIREQINSILPQLNENDEIIISDNESEDKTLYIINSFSDPRIKVFSKRPLPYHTTGKLGTAQIVASNMENALLHAKGEIIFFSDQDDVWLPNKVETVYNALQDCDCIVHDCIIVDENFEVISDTYFKYIKPKTSFLGSFYKPSFMGCCMAFNRKILDKALPFFQFPVEHDTWIGLCAIKFGKFKILPDKLIYYRRHNGNASFCVGGSKNSLFIKMKRRFYMLKAFFLRK